ncbi:MAG: protein kinase [Deltaproteobacteria bacterium]|nr:protein kinase [Deltaproteobacteria bacterium]
MEVREPTVGDVIAERYTIEQVLGRGGFGVVFRARHIDMDRPVALKVLLTTYARAEPSAVDRFRREARIAASLAYPNTVRLFDYGETDEGVFFIAMELLHGRTLTSLLETEGPLTPARAVHIASQTLYALTEAHAHGIVHRDIKPDNIMLTPLAYDPDHVKVMDFGIAKMVSEEHESQITRAGLTLGTPRYMPIEQIRGEHLTAATDLYAVGLVLGEMLTGEHAYDGDSAMDLVMAILDGPAFSLADHPEIPADLRAVVERAAAKEPSARYASARELLAALAPWRASESGAPAPAPRQTPARAASGPEAPTQMIDAPRQPAAPTALRPAVFSEPQLTPQADAARASLILQGVTISMLLLLILITLFK